MVNLGRQVFSFDARLYKDSLFEEYDQIFELWMQYGDDEVWVKATGDNQPRRLTKQEMRGNFVVVPNGDISLLSRTLEQQRAFAMLELATKDQSGALDVYNAWENYLLKADPRAAKRLLRGRQQFEQIQNMRLQMEQQEHQKKLEVAGRTPSANVGGVRLGQTQSGLFSGNPLTSGGGRQV